MKGLKSITKLNKAMKKLLTKTNNKYSNLKTSQRTLNYLILRTNLSKFNMSVLAQDNKNQLQETKMEN